MTLLVSTAALAAAAAAPSSPSAAESRACTPLVNAVQIQILGDRSWGWRIGSYSAIPAKTTAILAWSTGGPPATDGLAAYGWTTKTRSGFYSKCSTGRAAAQPAGSLRAPVRVKDRWFFGRKYTCFQPGRFVVAVSDISGGKRLTVRVQKTGKLLALGEVHAGGGWLRGSKSCAESER